MNKIKVVVITNLYNTPRWSELLPGEQLFLRFADSPFPLFGAWLEYKGVSPFIAFDDEEILHLKDVIECGVITFRIKERGDKYIVLRRI